jgi:hypothetical protein
VLRVRLLVLAEGECTLSADSIACSTVTRVMTRVIKWRAMSVACISLGFGRGCSSVLRPSGVLNNVA